MTPPTESDLAESRVPDALHEEQSTAAGADSPQSPHPHRTMTLLEGLPTEIVSLIGDQMDPSSLVKLRSTSRTMNDHLSFNIKRLFKELWCPLNLPKMEEIFWLMRQPLANSVQSLIWIRPDGAFMESTRESSLFPWTLTGYVECTAV